MLAVSKETVYGKRAGVIRGLAVVHKEKSNVIRGSRGWKLGCVHDVDMLPRAVMYKPDVSKPMLAAVLFLP